MFLAQIRAENLDRARRKSVSEEEEKMKAGLGFVGDRWCWGAKRFFEPVNLAVFLLNLDRYIGALGLSFYAHFSWIDDLSDIPYSTDSGSHPIDEDWADKNIFCVEQLEPKILLSAAPIDAPIEQIEPGYEASENDFLEDNSVHHREYILDLQILP